MKEVVKKMESKRKHLKAAASLMFFVASSLSLARGDGGNTEARRDGRPALEQPEGLPSRRRARLGGAHSAARTERSAGRGQPPALFARDRARQSRSRSLGTAQPRQH